RYSLYFPEKRPFFLERGAVFEFPLGNSERLFHSRRIGVAGGQRVPIHGGVRLVGRMGGWDLGFLDMESAETPSRSAENRGLLRVRRQTFNENSYVGGIVTTRMPRGDGESNVLYGLDGVIRLFGQDYLSLVWSQSFGQDGDPEQDGALDRSLARLLWERRGAVGLGYRLDLSHVGAGYEPGLGFLRRRDYARVEPRLAYGWRPGPESRFLRHIVAVEGFAFRRNTDGVVESAEVKPGYLMELKSRHAFTGYFVHRYESLDRDFTLPDGTWVPQGEYGFNAGELRYAGPYGSLTRLEGSLVAGDFFDGSIVSLRLTPFWRPSRHLRVSGTYRLDRVRFPGRDQAFDAHVAALRLQLMFDRRLSASTLLQYNSTSDRVTANVRLRLNPGEGHDLYLVW
ncbi:MAG TPA: hypothetical protein VLA43_04910, partial [Longimicrobiales bacterium]|nr:hypothetical protein [Longimicrobiales bacterium]